MNKNICTYCFLFIAGMTILFGQMVPYEEPSLLQNINTAIPARSLTSKNIDQLLNINIIKNGAINQVNSNTHLFYKLSLAEDNIYDLSFDYEDVPIGTKLFIIEGNKFLGPILLSGTNDLVQRVSGKDLTLEIIFQIDNLENVQLSLSDISLHEQINPNLENEFVINKSSNREPVILVTGFWPPTNEMIRHFSQNIFLNDNWEGENWQDRGYNIISYFPQFSDPDCNNCGQGYGDLEVDYQDTSTDFWDIVEEHSPVAIITFSRGYIDQSWELEFNYYNRTNWYPDYSTPTLPTPNPPDEDVESYYLRNSTLPMENIMDAINESDLGLDSYIDADGDPGRFVSEFMGYHGVWYHDINIESCVVAGHIHVGGLIDWDTAKEATEISILKTIDYLDQFSYTEGDVNADGMIDILDLVILVNVILGVVELDLIETYAADMNLDGTINIQDIILIINMILA
tara:strand:+ start:1372 stop:2742 length:1371 start_codon:yes stop_codon:yes gene_type:complete